MEQKRIGIDVPIKLWEDIGVIAKREHRPIKDIGKELFEKYALEHGEGNDQYTMDPFMSKSDMQATPATMVALPIWQEFIDKIDEKRFREIETQIYALQSKLDTRFGRGFD